MWAPFSRPAPVEVPLECSGGEASIVCTPWGAGERLAYEDGATTYVRVDDTGAREVRAGSLIAFAVSLIVTDAHGFPPMPSGEAFDPTRVDHLKALDSVVYNEIKAHALRVQPLPGQDKGDDAAEPAAAGPSNVEAPADEDPSPAP